MKKRQIENIISSNCLEEEKKTVLIRVIHNKIVLPGIINQIKFDKNDATLNLLRTIYKNHHYIGIVQSIDSKKKISYKNLYRSGTFAHIIDIVLKNDGYVYVLVKGISKFILNELNKNEKLPDAFYFGLYDHINENFNRKTQKKDQILLQSLKESVMRLLKYEAESHYEIEEVVQNLDDISFLTYFATAVSSVNSKNKQKVLEEEDIIKKIKLALKFVLKDLDISQLKRNIKSKIHKDITEQQREFFLRQEIKAIQNELGENDNELNELLLKAQKKKLPENVFQHIESIIKKAERIPIHSAEYPNQVNYLEYLIDMPWHKSTIDNFDIKHAEKILNKFHFGMEKIKERILEYIAVMKLKREQKGPILCLHGPPGVGKTSLIKSIAKALNRKYARISLGAISDEADIRGHRRTYVGAMPGKIIQNIKQTGYTNPIINLDEIDKISNHRNNTSDSLLEVLDYEQNNQFIDNYLEIPYDLSKIIFIATANDIYSISKPLRDRIEFIEVSGYSTEEKIEIAKKYIIPEQQKEHGLDSKSLGFKSNTIEKIIENYTFESGVRDLKRKIAQINRKVAKIKSIDINQKKISIESEDLNKYLGIPTNEFEKNPTISQPGTAIGLAYTSGGGKILYIETIATKGKGKIIISGQLGDIMKESAMAAFTYLKSNSKIYDINYDLFENYDIHLHVPDGATPKDGPSAGITIMTALLSLFTQKQVKNGITMTGEITITGKVLPVGGIKEKVLAAKRSSLKNIILSELNKNDIEEIPEIYLKDINFHYIKNANQLADLVLKKKKSIKNIFESFVK